LPLADDTGTQPFESLHCGVAAAQHMHLPTERHGDDEHKAE
jgi:hypothetical protein